MSVRREGLAHSRAQALLPCFGVMMYFKKVECCMEDGFSGKGEQEAFGS